MFQAPVYMESVSVKLSEVLSDIGVDEKTVLKRRRAALLIESMEKIISEQLDDQVVLYNVGSQSEGTTTVGLKSDGDQIACTDFYNVIQDRNDKKQGVHNFLMIQDDTVSPGYCLLLRNDTLLPAEARNKYFFNKFLLKNEFLSKAGATVLQRGIRHGPANTIQGKPGMCDKDHVFAFHSKSWPLQARQWLNCQGVGQWPSAEMRRYCGSTGFFLVGVGSKGSKHEEFEWRISTSLAERHLMFSLNITQIQCYVLMKIILKTFIKPYFEDTISSYMCKTVMFHCIANTHSNIWRENNILGCLSLCLFVLHNYILNENCPHFFIPENNLMKGKISHTDKPYILQKLCHVVTDRCTALLEIECDDLGSRLQAKMNNSSSFKPSDSLSGHLLLALARNIDGRKYFLSTIRNNNKEAVQTLWTFILNLADISNQCEEVDKTACRLFAQMLCTFLGTALASRNIHLYSKISAEAVAWIRLGLDTDVSSGKLKLASIYYCTGDTWKTEMTLKNIERSYDLNTVEPVCGCHYYQTLVPRKGFLAISNDHNEEAIQHITAFCVKFLPYETECVPHELQYEMFKSMTEDLAFKPPDDYTIKWAVVDSLPYLYFLQYKTYKSLGRQDEKKKALSNLFKTIDQEPNLGHRETALNLLGQCMEQENQATEALRCYIRSLNLRERNNVAKIHICRLLSSFLSNK
ncbi:uncharacterized protein LOC123566074 [Mercenaria mercenaria]|uniref:uncharacterized protein LOC123566074 n=1 Tax=Mercenaria mercenaria TaxID=6596 RepID=UPI00234E8A6E|nr:uncharacterized protein LOC123566074 [Mercenaria mercenaria]XP_045215842.2 uncharacterized protein LOC123566074 [Mercenaria mercenaria]